MSSSILFVDPRVADYQSLLVYLSADVEVFVLNAEKDGVLQMAAVLEGRGQLDAIQVLSHGSRGALSLGSTQLSADNLGNYEAALGQIGASLSESGDILLYGCDVAKGEMGLHFADELASMTKADIAASSDLTGDDNQGGNWNLEYYTGSIETTVFNPKNYYSLLATFNGTNLDDRLEGTTGADIFNGLNGNDVYIVNNAGDVVNENPNEGDDDSIETNISYTLPANVENLSLTGSNPINGSGNNLNNYIAGNSSDNILDGKSGNDSFSVEAGNDTYVFGIGSGQDTIDYSWNFFPENYIDTIQLGANILTTDVTVTRDRESLYLNINNTTDKLTLVDWFRHTSGNSITVQVKFSDNTTWDMPTLLSKIISTATDGDDLLVNILGEIGANTLNGLKGDDIYVVDNLNDVINENINEGNDSVESSVNYTLPNNVENLTLTGIDSINGTGNELNNNINGNEGNNILNGGAGNDVIFGGEQIFDSSSNNLGNGSDTYIFDIGSGQDHISDYDNSTIGNIDTIQLGKGITTTSLVVTRNQYELRLNISGTTDEIITGINDIEQINFFDGTIWNTTTITSKIIATDGDDYLEGDINANNLSGLKGNDTYLVDHVDDVVNENIDEGLDSIQSSITYKLPDNVENISLIGNSNINATGNRVVILKNTLKSID